MNRNSAHSELNSHMIYAREQQNGRWELDVSGRLSYFDTEDGALNEGLMILKHEEGIVAHREAAKYDKFNDENYIGGEGWID